jgi:predicted Zn-dependent protease
MTDDNLIKTMADIGFMASSTGMSKHAFGIFSALEKVRPDSVLPTLGFAMCFINKKMNQEALEILHKEAIPKDPEHPAVKAFIGMALMLEGRNKESEDILVATAAMDDPEASVMAKELLSDLHKS